MKYVRLQYGLGHTVLKDCIKPYIHVIGHTSTQKISISDYVINTDTLANSTEYLKIIDHKEIITTSLND